MKSALIIAACSFLLLVPGTSASAQSPNDELTQLVGQLQKTPTDGILRERILRLAAATKPAPTVPPDAERYEGRAQYAFKNAKTESEMLEAAREYIKAVDAAPWVAGYYVDLCTILERANRPAEAIRACKFYLIAAPDASDASEVRKRVAGLEFAVEKMSSIWSSRHECFDLSDMYYHGAKVAQIGSKKVSVKLISTLLAGVMRNQILLADTTSESNIVIQRRELDPIDESFQLNDRVKDSPYYRLTISRDGRITLGGYGSSQAEINTSIAELLQLRNAQLNTCYVAEKEGRFFASIPQGGPPRGSDGSLVAGRLFFESDCKGILKGDRPGWLPAGFDPHATTTGVNRSQSFWYPENGSFRVVNSCKQPSADALGWLGN